jgi:hypothetical protein
MFLRYLGQRLITPQLELGEGSRKARFRNGWFVRPLELKVKFKDRKLVKPA